MSGTPAMTEVSGGGCDVFFFWLSSNPPPLPNSGAGFPSVPVGKSPMVEQAVQTGSLDNLNTKKLFPGKGTVGMQLNGRPAPPSSKTASGTETRGPRSVLPILSFSGNNYAPHPEHHVLLQGRPLPHGPGRCCPLPALAYALAGACLTLPFCALDVAQPATVQAQGQVNDENRRPQRRRSGNSRCHLSPGPEPPRCSACPARFSVGLLEGALSSLSCVPQ